MTQATPEPAPAPAVFRLVGAASGFVGKYAASALLVAIVLIMAYEVVARNLFGRPTTWALEYAIYSQILFVALSAAYVLREEGHVSIGLVLEQLSQRKRNGLLCISSIAGAVYCAVLTVQMWKTASWSLRVGTASETMGVPLAPLQFVLAAGLCLLGLQFIARGFAYGTKAVSRRVAPTSDGVGDV
ncbi:MAG: TRAP transporter small permease [Burkholderiaceae bacterium]|nr:TRAP transporter small permease [Burkholderiaceae bacterium]